MRRYLIDFATAFERVDLQPLPAYERIKAAVTEQIREGSLGVGDRVPSENELVSTLGVSRMTVNRAFRELAAEGVLARTRGRGTFVAEPKAASALMSVRNIAEEITQRGHQHRTRVQWVREQSARDDDALAASLRQESAEKRLFRSLLIHLDNEAPIQLEDRCVNPDLAPEYLTQDFTAVTPHDYLSRTAPMTGGSHVVEAVVASAEEERLLNLSPGEPCLQVTRRTWSGSVTASAARLLHPGSRARLEGRFGTESSGSGAADTEPAG